MLIPIVTPSIDWKNYLGAARQSLGRSVSSCMDGAHIPPSPKGFIVSLHDLSEQDEPTDLDSLGLKHLSYTFLAFLMEGTYNELIEQCSVTWVSGHDRPGLRLAVVSGSLEQWKVTVASCSCSSNADVKGFGVEVKNYFDSIGLSDIWKHYIKIKQSDKTLRLLPHA